MSYDTFKGARRFDALEQLRTISVLWIVAYHMQDDAWLPLHGPLAVPVFFIVSGFLITTLLLREEEKFGRVALGQFYVRRVFRILPLYYLVLMIFAVLILGAGLGGEVEEFTEALPYYLTYQNDFAEAAPFGHSWTLAVEEKFYLLWPAIVFFLLRRVRKARLPLAAALTIATILAGALEWEYFAIYTPILAGCLVAMVMHSPKGFAVLRPITSPMVTAALVLMTIGIGVLDASHERDHVWFSLALAMCLPGLVLGRGWMSRPSALPSLVKLGKLTYSAYLIHPLLKSAVDLAVPAGQDAFAPQLLRLSLTLALCFFLASLLYRFFEKPFIRWGHRLAGGPRPDGANAAPERRDTPEGASGQPTSAPSSASARDGSTGVLGG